MSHFDLVVFVYCRDLRGRTIQDYVEETYPPFMQVRHYDSNVDDCNIDWVAKVGAVEKVDLTKWAEHRHKMLFVLDGLDECSQVYMFRRSLIGNERI